MAGEIPSLETKARIGEMPTARYMRKAIDTTGDGLVKWIGMEAYSPDGRVREFLWWRNFPVGDLSQEKARHDAASFVASLKLEMQVDSAFGPAVDSIGSDPDTGLVKILDGPNVYGVYVEADKRAAFDFNVRVKEIRSEAELSGEAPVEFDALLQRAKAVLPRPSEPPAPGKNSKKSNT